MKVRLELKCPSCGHKQISEFPEMPRTAPTCPQCLCDMMSGGIEFIEDFIETEAPDAD